MLTRSPRILPRTLNTRHPGKSFVNGCSLMRCCPSSEPPRHGSNENDYAEDEAVDHERPSGKSLQYAHQAPDREER
jgi:hypothetical protein